ncbi:cytochrome c biogenesis CcdA family protein [Lentzea flava]|uniref:Cytochrome C biogenesis protein CcdA n=1 Tax=Lentzea flava TaxID=103732 RepID=A0ABQ2VHC2_9PSEU|nr:cytochrome c biogenesis protein CcdA [Lentzea flava]MCP2205093.1 Cytochrome c biogenesis protein CcdA [Lentzea flava]GGU83656.1 cytochrome C biogenesis protein CcdA [Lentzea flava]
MTQTLLVALVAGMVATVNPCGFAMLPAYLALVVTGAGEQSRARLLTRAAVSSAMMTLGFVTVFGLFGLVFSVVASSVQRYLPFVTVVIGLALVVLGVLLLAGKEITLLVPKPSRGAPNRHVGSMFGYGMAYAIASLSCTIGPFLAVAGSTLRSGDVVEGVAAFLAYAAGMGLVVTVLAIGTALASDVVTRRARSLLPHVSRLGGVLLVLVGAYVTYYGIYELRLFFGGADPADPVVDAAGKVQGLLVDWFSAIGPVPFVVALAVLVAGGVLLVRRRGRVR